MFFNKCGGVANKIRVLVEAISKSRRTYLVPFYQGHSYLSNEMLDKIARMVGENEEVDATLEFESRISKYIGQGNAVAFASGRMGFYCLLRSLNVGVGDEVLLTGFTCSVMVNAVLRTGATPVFVDIDSDRLGTDPIDVERKLTSRTKVIVAQHSFGLPCRIKEIVSIGLKHNIFVIEDCAITFDSSIDGIKVGTWGDAAIFSTDHSKPMNTLIGGFVFIKNTEIYHQIIAQRNEAAFLDKGHQERLYTRILKEAELLKPEKYAGFLLDSLINSNKLTFLDRDYTRLLNKDSFYPYPAQMPAFLAKLGIYELDIWKKKRDCRKEILGDYLEIIKKYRLEKYFPNAYFDSSLDIVPLRLIMIHPDALRIKNRMSKKVDIGGIWFNSPIICCPEGLDSLGYSYGSCPTSELICAHIINWPIIFESDYWRDKVLKLFDKILASIE